MPSLPFGCHPLLAAAAVGALLRYLQLRRREAATTRREAVAKQNLKPTLLLPDGRALCICKDAAEFTATLCEEVTRSAAAAIAAKGSFSLMLPAGSVIKALAQVDLPEYPVLGPEPHSSSRLTLPS